MFGELKSKIETYPTANSAYAISSYKKARDKANQSRINAVGNYSPTF